MRLEQSRDRLEVELNTPGGERDSPRCSLAPVSSSALDEMLKKKMDEMPGRNPKMGAKETNLN